jgi:hypothetical protein
VKGLSGCHWKETVEMQVFLQIVLQDIAYIGFQKYFDLLEY